MDHSHMTHDHSAMDPSTDTAAMPGMCSMNMLFTWNTQNLCIIFRWWHIRSTLGLILSLVAIVLLTAAFEALRDASRRYERWVAKETEDVPRRNQDAVSRRVHVIKAGLYAVQTFYGFMLMLLFMTYNGWVMLAMFVGSFVGYLSFGGGSSATKEGACH